MAHPDPFVHLHVHTQYSLLDGANQIDLLLEEAARQRMPALAITDHGNLFGAIEFYRKARKKGVNPIIGCEVYLAPGSRFDKEAVASPQAADHDGDGGYNPYYHLILLAADAEGYRNLIRLVSLAYVEGFYYKPRMDKELLRRHGRGLIATSGCLRGEVPYLLAQGRIEEAERAGREYIEIFGPGNFYIEIQDNGLEKQVRLNRELIALGGRLSIPIVATNDCHYLRQEDARAHDILLCLQTGKTVNDPNRMRFHTDQLYFKSSDQMHAAFAEIPGAIRSTQEIAERCNLDLRFDTFHLPLFQAPPGYTLERYLEEQAAEGLEQRLKAGAAGDHDRYRRRLREELATINKMGYAGYFLIVWDIIRFARSREIPVGPGRGSAAGSVVAYALRITDIDPLRYGLLFERFLNPERVTLPDIDMDFCMDRRDEVIKYVMERYGTDHVAQIITFGTMAARAVIRDVGRVLEIPYADVDRVAKLIPATLNITLDEALAQEPRLREVAQADPRMGEMVALARSLEGLARHASTHAAGVVISQAPLIDHVPLYRGTNGEIVTQFAKDEIEQVGLVKFDLLGLKTLTVIRHAVRLVNEQRARDGRPPLDLDALSPDDPETYRLLGTGRTTGIFQLESAGMRDLLIRLKPEGFEDLIAILALYRPGPIGSGMVDDFVKRKRGIIPIKYDIPGLEPILKETYGVIVYQEQVMQIANTIAGFSLGQADLLRRAMGKKLPEEMEQQKSRFLEGAAAKGIGGTRAEKLFDLIAFFAGYGFNKSHSAAYAMVTYQTAYLRAHHPVELMAALLTSDMGNEDKIVKYIEACRSSDIPVLPPDLNESESDFTIIRQDGEGRIRFGMAAVKNVGEAAIEAVLEARRVEPKASNIIEPKANNIIEPKASNIIEPKANSKKGGPFRSLFDFCRRVDSRRLNRRALESLIKAGVFDSTGARRSQLIDVLEQAIEEGNQHRDAEARGQFGLFGPTAPGEGPGDGSAAPDPPLPDIPEWDDTRRLRAEKEALGFYITGHPLRRFLPEIRKVSTADSETLGTARDGAEVRLAGLVAGRRITQTKKGDRMAYLRLEDLQGSVEVIVFPDLYKAAAPLIEGDQPVLVTGFVDRGEKGTKLKATGVIPLEEVRRRATQRVEIRTEGFGMGREDFLRLREVLARHRGACPVQVRLRLPDQSEALLSVDETLSVAPEDALVADLEQIFGSGCVTFH